MATFPSFGTTIPDVARSGMVRGALTERQPTGEAWLAGADVLALVGRGPGALASPGR